MILSLLLIRSFAQAPALSKEEYLQKSKTQNTIGWILAGGGTTMIVVGSIVFSKGNYLGPDNGNTDTGGILIIAGLVADVASIPFFISSAHNSRKAATISFNNRRIILPRGNGMAMVSQPTVTLSLHW